MKIMFRSLAILILIISTSIINIAASRDRKCEIIVTAKVTRIGEKPHGVSGRSAVYWIATYSIVESLKGRPNITEIKVAHLVLTGNELMGIQIGDKVLLCLSKCNKKLQDTIYQSADYDGALLLVNCDCGEKK
jgi:hypothetical protein